MGNRSFETITKLNKNNVEKQKKFSYDTNNLNQYLDRSIYVDIEEAVEETGTGEIIPDTTSTGSIEVVDTEVITEEEFLEEEIIEEVIEDEEEIELELELELEGRLLYDANGNMIGNMLNNKRQYIYSYDYKNRLVKIEKNIYKKVNGSETNELEHKQKIVQIQYDVLGRRIQKLFNNGGYRNYIYSNQHVILEENYSKKDKVNSEGRESTLGYKLKNSKEFIYSNSLDDVLSMKLIENKTRKIEEEFVNKKGVTKTRKIKESYVETNIYFYQKDHLGSIIAITDETGTIVEEYVYDIFGKPYSKQIDGKITALKKSPIGNTRMYTGREYDRGLKLYYNRARYYDPKLARFISRDPIDIADDVNLYAYVGNNSVMFVDLMGLEGKPISIKAREKTMEIIEVVLNGRHSSLMTYISEDVNKYVENSAIMFTIIYEEQAHLFPPIIEDIFPQNTIGLSQISIKASKSDKKYFGFSDNKKADLLNIEKHLNIMNTRINTIKEKLVEEGKKVTPGNIGSAWNGGRNCVLDKGCPSESMSYGNRIENNYGFFQKYNTRVTYNRYEYYSNSY